MVNNPITERFTLVNATNGVYRYDGNKPICARVFVIVTGSGSASTWRFTTSVNGAIPVFANAFYSTIDILDADASVSVAASNFEELVNGDTIQVMVAGDGHSNNITIAEFQIQIQD